MVCDDYLIPIGGIIILESFSPFSQKNVLNLYVFNNIWIKLTGNF